MKLILIAFALLMFCAALPCSHWGEAAGQTRRTSRVKSAKRYACPMHPEVVSNRPRKCPKCGMDLRLAGADASTVTIPTSEPVSPPTEETSSFSSSRIPNVSVYTQDGVRVNFYSDLVKGKTVAINFIFTTCTTICPPLTATFRRVQQDLAQKDLPVQLISISVDPTTDTPERLHYFATKFKAGPGWTFVTGEKTEIDSLLQALGVAVSNKNDHTPMILIGNDVTGYWTRSYGLSPSTALISVITEAAGHK